jgi:hypothetical protein
MLVEPLISLVFVVLAVLLLRRSLAAGIRSQHQTRIAALAAAVAMLITAWSVNYFVSPPTPHHPPATIGFDQAVAALNAHHVRSVYVGFTDPTDAMSQAMSQGEVAFLQVGAHTWDTAVIPAGFTDEFTTLLSRAKVSTAANPPQRNYNAWADYQAGGLSTASSLTSLWYLLLIVTTCLLAYGALTEYDRYASIARIEVELGLRPPRRYLELRSPPPPAPPATAPDNDSA